MTTPELPPLHHGPTTDASWDNPPTKHVTLASVEARERILQSRIAELEAAITELLESEPEHCPCGDEGCELGARPWLRARAAIDAARGKA